jgi:hypothetical protein
MIPHVDRDVGEGHVAQAVLQHEFAHVAPEQPLPWKIRSPPVPDVFEKCDVRCAASGRLRR